MRRTGRALPEQEVIECSIRMTEALEMLVQQSPPLVHGLIQPEHIIIGTEGTLRYTLTHFSIVFAGGATQFIVGVDRSRLGPYAAPEIAQGIIDPRGDLYSLVATAYHAATGSMPTEFDGSIPLAQRLNPNVSSRFEALLARGLKPDPTQRYQHPEELRQELLTLRPGHSMLSLQSDEALRLRREAAFPLLYDMPGHAGGVARTMSHLRTADLIESGDARRKALLPRPEDLLPYLEMRNEARLTTLWLTGILVCMAVLVMLSRGFL
jgi:serine/threonine protein kinase